MKSFTAGNFSISRAQEAWVRGRQSGERGAWDEAVRQFKKAARLHPDDALYGLNLADALLKVGRPHEAAEAARSAYPGSPLATALLVQALAASLQYEKLVEVLDEAPQAHVTPELLSWKGGAQFKLGKSKDAVQTFLRLVMLKPHEAAAHYRLGLAFNDLTLKQEASECFRTALMLGLGPLEVGVRDLLAFYEREVCEWRGGDTQVQELRSSIARLPPGAAVQTNPFAHVTLLDDPVLQHQAAAASARHIARDVVPLPARQPEARSRLRIGYASSDFHRHATSYLMAQLIEGHDRQRFEIFLYSFGPDDGSPTRERISTAADHFIEAQRMSLPEMARRIRADGIDILVDLKGYTKDARPGLFAYQAAPVQAAYLGFPGTSGAPSIDYIIGDAWVTPLEHAAHFSEKIAQLPGCYQCNDGTRKIPQPPTRSAQGLPENGLVLCGFNQPYKISPEVFDVWCRLLRQVPGSVLWLLEWHHQAPPALRREAQARGVDPERLIFAKSLPQAEHLDRIACADLFLDTWPCNAHTTASDVLWAGVPMVTLTGMTFASRVAGSLLHEMGLDDLITKDVASYEDLALKLATQASQLTTLRQRVEAARSTSSLFDGSSIARRLEGLYGRMWARALQGLAPDHLPA